MGHRIVLVTDNEGKIWEIRLILTGLGPSILSIKGAGAEPEIVEDGITFRENAEIKARVVWNLTGDIVLTDDFGLKVDHISKEPGVYSARYLGEDTPYEVKNRNIIERLREAAGQRRGTRFVYSIAVMLPDGQVFHTGAVTEGLIAGEPAGNGGSGYGPILYLPWPDKTPAETTMEQKNEISHRGKVLRAMKEVLEGALK